MKKAKSAKLRARLSAALDEAKRRDDRARALAIKLGWIGWVATPAVCSAAVAGLWRASLRPGEPQTAEAFFQIAQLSLSRAWEDGWAITTGGWGAGETAVAAFGALALAGLLATPIALACWAPFSGLCGLAAGWRTWPGSMAAQALDRQEADARQTWERHQERAQLWSAAQKGRENGRRVSCVAGEASAGENTPAAGRPSAEIKSGLREEPVAKRKPRRL